MMTSRADAIAQLRAVFARLNAAMDAGQTDTTVEHEDMAVVVAEYVAFGNALRRAEEAAETAKLSLDGSIQ